MVRSAADEVLRAMADIGMRASYSFALRDRNLVYEADDDFVARLPAELQPTMRAHFDGVSLTLEDQLQLFHGLREDFAGRSRQRIRLAPANIHWCSMMHWQRLLSCRRTMRCRCTCTFWKPSYQKNCAMRRTRQDSGRAPQRHGNVGIA